MPAIFVLDNRSWARGPRHYSNFEYMESAIHPTSELGGLIDVLLH